MCVRSKFHRRASFCSGTNWGYQSERNFTIHSARWFVASAVSIYLHEKFSVTGINVPCTHGRTFLDCGLFSRKLGLIRVSWRREKGGFQKHLGTRCKNMVMREKRKIDEERGVFVSRRLTTLSRAGIHTARRGKRERWWWWGEHLLRLPDGQVYQLTLLMHQSLWLCERLWLHSPACCCFHFSTVIFFWLIHYPARHLDMEKSSTQSKKSHEPLILEAARMDRECVIDSAWMYKFSNGVLKRNSISTHDAADERRKRYEKLLLCTIKFDASTIEDIRAMICDSFYLKIVSFKLISSQIIFRKLRCLSLLWAKIRN